MAMAISMSLYMLTYMPLIVLGMISNISTDIYLLHQQPNNYTMTAASQSDCSSLTRDCMSCIAKKGCGWCQSMQTCIFLGHDLNRYDFYPEYNTFYNYTNGQLGVINDPNMTTPSYPICQQNVLVDESNDSLTVRHTVITDAGYNTEQWKCPNPSPCATNTNCVSCISSYHCDWCIQGSVCSSKGGSCFGGWLNQTYQCNYASR